MPTVESTLWGWQLNDPYEQYNYPSAGGQLMDPFDFTTAPLPPHQGENEGNTTPTPTVPIIPNGGSPSYDGSQDGDPGGGSDNRGGLPYSWDAAYWGGNFSPDYGIKDYLRELGYGGSALKGGLLRSVLGNALFGSPLNDPAVVSGLQEFAQNYNLDYDTLRDQIDQAYGGLSNKSALSVLGQHIKGKVPEDILNNIVFASDTLRGIAMGATPEYSFFNQLEMPSWKAAQQYDALRAMGYGADELTDPNYYGSQLLEAIAREIEFGGWDPSRSMWDPYKEEWSNELGFAKSHVESQAASAARREAFNKSYDDIMSQWGKIPDQPLSRDPGAQAAYDRGMDIAGREGNGLSADRGGGRSDGDGGLAGGAIGGSTRSDGLVR